MVSALTASYYLLYHHQCPAGQGLISTGSYPCHPELHHRLYQQENKQQTNQQLVTKTTCIFSKKNEALFSNVHKYLFFSFFLVSYLRLSN